MSTEFLPSLIEGVIKDDLTMESGRSLVLEYGDKKSVSENSSNIVITKDGTENKLETL